jgi:hypothetical protein
MNYIAGLDLGQAQDFTALAIAEQTTRPSPTDPDRRENHYAVRHLERFPLKTPYTSIVGRVRDILSTPAMAKASLAVDNTGVGRPVTDLLARAGLSAYPHPITITAGARATPAGGGGWNVPKRDLVGTVQLLLQSRRLLVAKSLPHAETLKRELQTFQVKITAAANEVYGAWREGAHDDLLLAVALATWLGEYLHPPQRMRIHAGPLLGMHTMTEYGLNA